MSEIRHDSNALDLKRATGIARFGELALKSNDLNEILTEACHLVGEVLGTDLAKVVELLADGKTMSVRAGVGWGPNVVGVASVIAAEDTSEGYCLRTGEPMISADIAKETRFEYPQFLIDNGVRAIANVVIIGGYNRPPFGILEVDSREPREFTEADTLFLRSYANLLAAAVDRVRVTNEMLEYEARLQCELKEAVEKRTSYLTEAVAKRTRELTVANELLKVEAKERASMEEVLRQAIKMEALGKLTGGIAHDFNNLLAIISGSLQLIAKRVTQGRYCEIGGYMDAATASVARAEALTHRLLAFSRQQTLDPKPTDVNSLIEGMRDIFSSTVGPSIKIETTLAPKLWPVLCDPHQLENALLNLIINARDAMPNGGLIRIETSNCILTDERISKADSFTESVPNGEFISLFITDTGMGMPPTVIERAIDPFFTTKPLGKGTGLGLSMVYGYIQQSGGYISLQSSEGHGTTVAIYLRHYLGDEEGIMTIDSPENSNHAELGVIVLLVEDEPAIRLMMADTLTDDGYTVLEAYTGPGAMRHILSPARIDLLVTDIGLPGGMNGRQLADAARQHRTGLKVLFVTGYDEQAARGTGLMESGMAIITKPFNIDLFSAKVRDLLQAPPGGS
jgi:signal transduction histidine kinase